MILPISLELTSMSISRWPVHCSVSCFQFNTVFSGHITNIRLIFNKSSWLIRVCRNVITCNRSSYDMIYHIWYDIWYNMTYDMTHDLIYDIMIYHIWYDICYDISHMIYQIWYDMINMYMYLIWYDTCDMIYHMRYELTSFVYNKFSNILQYYSISVIPYGSKRNKDRMLSWNAFLCGKWLGGLFSIRIGNKDIGLQYVLQRG